MNNDDFDIQPGALNREDEADDNFLFWSKFCCAVPVFLAIGVWLGQIFRGWFVAANYNEKVALLLLVASGLTIIAAFAVMVLKAFSGVIEDES